MQFGGAYDAALKDALNGQCSVWRYTADFETLWSEAFEPDGTILIIWDPQVLAGSADDEKLLEPHLTPLDWALAWSIKRGRDREVVPPIVIVDITAGSWKNSWVWKVRHQLAADMPWVTLTAPLPSLYGDKPAHEWIVSFETLDREPSTDGVVRKDRERRWTIATNWTPRALNASEQQTLAHLHRFWAASLNQSDEHHDINNVVGARVMLQYPSIRGQLDRIQGELDGDAEECLSIPWPRESLIFAAFLKRVSWSSQISEAPSHAWYPWRFERHSISTYLFNNKISFTVCDDKYWSGWGAFLYAALWNTEGYPPDAYVSPDKLIEFLRERAVFDRRDFTASVFEDSQGQPEIIFLDLRLYSSADHAKLVKDTKDLIEIAKRVSKNENPAWDKIRPKELTDIERWVEGAARPSSEWHDRALLLLPRLLALALPLTPIILFSSTAQARIREVLKPYRNIFTGFQKPNPLGDPASVSGAATALNHALDHAMPMLRRRMQLAELQKIYSRLKDEQISVGLLETAHADLYFDETGKAANGIISAAACNIYDNISVSDRIQDHLLEQFNSSGTVWDKPRGQVAGAALKKGDKLGRRERREGRSVITNIIAREQVITLDGLLNGIDDCKTNSSVWAIFAIKSPKSKTTSAEIGGRLSGFIDISLDRSIRRNIETCIICYLPYRVRDYFSVSIHLPSRLIGGVASEFAARFQLKPSEYAPGKYRTYSPEAAFPLVRAWLQGWGDTYEKMAARVSGIYGRTLAHDAGTQLVHAEQAHLLHDIADWAAASVGIDGWQSDPRSIALRNAFRECGLYPHRFVSADEAGDAFERDFADLEVLLDALAIILRKKDVDQDGLAGAIRLIVTMHSLQDRAKLQRLENADPLKHHRLAIWRVMPYLQAASGAALLS